MNKNTDEQIEDVRIPTIFHNRRELLRDIGSSNSINFITGIVYKQVILNFRLK